MNNTSDSYGRFYKQEVMNQTDLSRILGVGKIYDYMTLSSKRKQSKAIAEKLRLLGVNRKLIDFKANKLILSHARLPIPTLHQS